MDEEPIYNEYVTKELIEKLKPFWKEVNEINAEYYRKIHELEIKMNEEVKPKVPLEFFWVDGEIVGIGSEEYEFRDEHKLRLIQEDELR